MKTYSIDPKIADAIESITNDFKWTFYDHTVQKENRITDKDVCQFIVNYNDYKKVIENIVNTLMGAIKEQTDYNIKKLVRAKFNLTLADGIDVEYSAPHADIWVVNPCISCVYYVNDSDGDTVFFDKVHGDDMNELNIIDSVSPKKGTFALFNSTRYHAKGKQTSKKRIVGNFVFLVEKHL